MIVKRMPDGFTRITRGDGTQFTYLSVCAPAKDDPHDADARTVEIIEDTCRTLLSGGYFYPEGFRWLRDNWGVSLEGGTLTLHPAVFDFARLAA